MYILGQVRWRLSIAVGGSTARRVVVRLLQEALNGSRGVLALLTSRCWRAGGAGNAAPYKPHNVLPGTLPKPSGYGHLGLLRRRLQVLVPGLAVGSQHQNVRRNRATGTLADRRVLLGGAGRG